MAIDLKFPGWVAGKAGADAPGAATLEAEGENSATGHETLAGATFMEDLRRGARAAKQPSRLPIIGGMPIARQFQVLAIGLVAFFILPR